MANRTERETELAAALDHCIWRAVAEIIRLWDATEGACRSLGVADTGGDVVEVVQALRTTLAGESTWLSATPGLSGPEKDDELDHLAFLVDFLYEALGPANDDVMTMAEEAWEESLK